MRDISFLCVNLSPVIFITQLIGALLVMVHLLECLFCLGVLTSFVDMHFANGQVRYSIWNFFFGDQIFVFSSKVRFKSVLHIR